MDAEFRCVFRREGKIQDPITLSIHNAEGWYWHQRGVLLSPLMQTHQTDNVLAAANLGFWETSRRFKEVLNVLRLLFTGRLGLKGLGGPGQIAYAAASEAEMGVSRLLLFLTFLSANLAILNFLPIPALDGGHMVFLTAEAIRGKPVNEELQVRLTMAGVLCLLSLMAFVIIKDILWFAN
jgi:regulator of sigma E protease